MDRRSFIKSLIAAPAIVAFDRIMPVKALFRETLFIDRTIYVSNDGTNWWFAPDGILERPWKTIADAMRQIENIDLNGHTVEVNLNGSFVNQTIDLRQKAVITVDDFNYTNLSNCTLSNAAPGLSMFNVRNHGTLDIRDNTIIHTGIDK